MDIRFMIAAMVRIPPAMKGNLFSGDLEILPMINPATKDPIAYPAKIIHNAAEGNDEI